MTPPRLRPLLAALFVSCGLATLAVVLNLFSSFSVARTLLWIAVSASVLAMVMSLVVFQKLNQWLRFIDEALTRMREGQWDENIPVRPGDELASLCDGMNRLAKKWKERQVLSEAFRRYVDPSLADHILRQGLKLGGETFQATILFADMRDFTELSELMTPQEMVGLLNQYFSLVEPIIHHEGGWVNKFGGDSLLAIFGAPVVFPDHVERAVRAGTRMRDAILDFNIRQRQVGGPVLRVGMGIHCGEVVVGHVGGAKRMEYTVIGDAVNMASRIQALHRKYGKSLLLSADAYRVVQDSHPATSTLPLLIVQGKSDPIQVYALD